MKKGRFIKRYFLLAGFFILFVSSTCPAQQLPDINSARLDLVVPEVTEHTPMPGKRVRQQLKNYKHTAVHHLLYLPTNWKKGEKYPVIVEYPGNGPYENKYGDVSTGEVAGCNLGFGISGGKDFIWVSMPFISEDGKENQKLWWGDIEKTKKYCVAVVQKICDEYGGDNSEIMLAGFSRGAIAVNYIGLHDDEIASLWMAGIAFSHYDGLKEWNYPNSDQASAIKRLNRLQGRSQFICAEGRGTDLTKKYLEETKTESDFTFLDIPYRNHTNTWVLRNIPERKIIRDWLSELLKNKRHKQRK